VLFRSGPIHKRKKRGETKETRRNREGENSQNSKRQTPLMAMTRTKLWRGNSCITFGSLLVLSFVRGGRLLYTQFFVCPSLDAHRLKAAFTLSFFLFLLPFACITFFIYTDPKNAFCFVLLIQNKTSHSQSVPLILPSGLLVFPEDTQPAFCTHSVLPPSLLSLPLILVRVPWQRFRVDRPLAVLKEGGDLGAGQGVRHGATEGVAACSLVLEGLGVAAVGVGLEQLQGLVVLLRGRRERGREGRIGGRRGSGGGRRLMESSGC
jgi:hypothetical protein